MFRRLPFFILTVCIVSLAAFSAHAQCTSPNAPAGAKEWFSVGNTYKFCIGSTWVNANDIGALGSCSTAGQWDYDSTAGAFKQCNGSTWRKLGCAAGGGGIFDSNIPNCTSNAGGPFVQHSITTNGNGLVSPVFWARDGYIFVLSNQHLRAYSHNGTGFVLLDTITYSSVYPYMVWHDGTYLYVGYGLQLYAYTFNGKKLTQVGSYTAPQPGWYITKVGNYLFMTEYDNDTLRALSFNGSSFTSLATLSLDSASVLGTNGTHLFVTKNGAVNAYTFNGTAFTAAGSYAGSPGTMAYDAPYLFIADGTGLRALTYNGSSFTSAGFIAPSDVVTNVWTDGAYVYITDFDSNLRAYSFNGSAFTEASSLSSYGAGLLGAGHTLVGDGRYIYALGSGGINAVSGFACSSPSPPAIPFSATCSSLGACASAGQVNYESANSRAVYCDGGDIYALDQNSAAGGGGVESGASPVWITPAGNIAEVVAGYNVDVFVKAEDESGTVTYSKVSGLSGITVSAAGRLTGAAADGNVVVRAQDGAGHFVDRTFTIDQTAIKVLCTYYNSRGMLPDHILEGDLAYAKIVDPQVGRAYRAWANPLIGWLRQHEGSWADRFVFHVVERWADEMAYRTGHGGEGNWTGRLLSLIGEPLHYIAGYFIPEDEAEKSIREQQELHVAQDAGAAAL